MLAVAVLAGVRTLIPIDALPDSDVNSSTSPKTSLLCARDTERGWGGIVFSAEDMSERRRKFTKKNPPAPAVPGSGGNCCAGVALSERCFVTGEFTLLGMS